MQIEIFVDAIKNVADGTVMHKTFTNVHLPPATLISTL
jgi:hypothetical protein